jgi:uncharacterized membrane protein HdeD (DUF308 family)
MNWWALALRGIAAIVFAILTFAVPGVTLAVIVILFGAYALVDGIFAIISAVRAARGHRPWGSFLLEGTVGVIIGLVTFFVPAVTLAFLIYLVGAWAIVTGVLEVAAAIRLRRYIAGEWLLALTGVISILFGILVYWAPLAGALAIVWWLGVYALVFGILLLLLSFRIRSFRSTSIAV